MTPREYVTVFRERWRVVVAGVVLGLLVATAAILLVPRQYSTEVVMLVSAQTDEAGATAQLDAGELPAQRIRTYLEVLDSTEMARQVVVDLALPLSPEEVAGRISASMTPDTTLLTATVTDGDPARAVLIATTLAEQFSQEIADLEEPSDPLQAPAVEAATFADPSPVVVVAPRPYRYLAAGAGLGLVAGLAGALLRNSLDTSVRRRRDVEDALGVPVVGAVPRARDVARTPLLVLDRPQSPAADAFRTLRTNLGLVGDVHEHSVVVVTSANAGDGRTSTVTNLGAALAVAGYRVLLVDADLRGPALAERLGTGTGIGLTDVLTSQLPVEGGIRPRAPGLDVLGSGTPTANPSELLGAPRTAELLARLRSTYDVVLVDAPPVAPFTDAAVLALRADGVLFVVRHGRTTTAQLETAKDALDAVSADVLGGVLTMTPGSGMRRHRPPARDTGQVPAGGPPPTAPPPGGPVPPRGSPVDVPRQAGPADDGEGHKTSPVPRSTA